MAAREPSPRPTERRRGDAPIPYASELFGVYQPLLGWQSRHMQRRVDDERRRRFDLAVELIARDAESRLASSPVGLLAIDDRSVSDPVPSSRTIARLWQVARDFRRDEDRDPDAAEWSVILNEDNLNTHLVGLQAELAARGSDDAGSPRNATFALARETAVASLLHWLGGKMPALVPAVVAAPEPRWKSLVRQIDPLAGFDPSRDLGLAFLSPIGLVHLYRQCFYELESFLGPAVGHVWLSPGGTLEMVEVSTRKTFTERFQDLFLETTSRTETSTMVQDELSEAIKEENERNTEMGVTASGGFSFAVAHGDASASYSSSTSRRQASETSHRHLREQSEKISNEIRKSYRSTFRTSAEVTDTSSRKHVITNPTDRLVNYELRRKMRRVAVQVQYLGPRMCWQVFVVDPGDKLSVAELVHVAQPEDVKPETVQAPDAPAPPQPITQSVTKAIHFDFIAGDDLGEVYVRRSDPIRGEVLVADEPVAFGGVGPNWDKVLSVGKPFKLPNKGPNYKVSSVDLLEFRGVEHEDGDLTDMTDKVALLEREIQFSEDGDVEVRVKKFHPHGYQGIEFVFDVTWEPRTQAGASQLPTNQELRDHHEAYVKAVRERIRLAGDVAQRPANELRQEERFAIYRRLVAQLFLAGINDDRFVTSEFMRSIFDLDRMLYFVAPEWWRSRRRVNRADELGVATSTPTRSPTGDPSGKMGREVAMEMVEEMKAAAEARANPQQLEAADKVGWGGVGESGRDNYLITEESKAARLGSSIGWLLQLDGDNHRNAFLNAPWVKAVIPIRPGREMAALNWLEDAGVEGADGLDRPYPFPEEDGGRFRRPDGEAMSLREVLAELAKDVQAETGLSTALASETVFENGFDPLAEGFRQTLETRANDRVFDEWTEILPTDQVVAVEYDPAGRI